MLKEFLRRYFAVPLIYRVGAAFVVGVLAGIVISRMGDLYGPQTVERTVAWIAPFGNALIAMLKMIVIPIIFFSLVSGAASLPIRKFGRLGTSVLGWYIFTSLFATVFGVILAMILNPRMQNAMEISGHLLGQVSRMKTAAAESGKGIRILKQAPEETIFSFIISSNNNISRIKKIVEAFCALFGEEIWVGNRLFYAFPKAEALKNATVEDLEPIHAGFRDKYLIDCARVLNENEDFIPSLSSLDADEARKKLKTIKGIGDKVADCILLFAFQKYDVFPKDVWINRVTREVFHENFSEKELGENAGIIQQYMFYFGRSNPDFLKFGTFDEQPRVFALDERPDLIKETAEALYDEFARESESAAFFERMVESSAKAKTALPKTFILTVKGRFAGTCGLWRSDLMTRQDLCPWLALLYVKPEYRKRHFGALLQKAVVEYAEKLGYEKVYLYTDLKKYYDKTGWKPFGKDLECDGTEKSLYEVETKDYGNEDK